MEPRTSSFVIFIVAVFFSQPIAMVTCEKRIDGDDSLLILQSLCEAQCMANCTVSDTAEYCNARCLSWSNTWIEQCSNISCAHSCTNARVEQELLADVPIVEVSELPPDGVLLKWQPASNLTNPLYYVIIAYKKTGSYTHELIIYNQTTSNLIRLENLDICSEYQFRVAAVNMYGNSGFSNLTESTGKLGMVEDLNVTGVFFENKHIVIYMTWKPPVGWEDDIQKYDVHITMKKCNKIVATSENAVFYPSTSMPARMDLSCEFQSCVVDLHMEANAGCKIGEKTIYELDLTEFTDCHNELSSLGKDILGLIPPQTSMKTVPIASEPWQVGNMFFINISWIPPGDVTIFDEYVIQWVPNDRSSSQREIKISKNETSCILKDLSPDTIYLYNFLALPNIMYHFKLAFPYTFNTTSLLDETTTYQTTVNKTLVSTLNSKKTVTVLIEDIAEDTSEDDKMNVVTLVLYITLPLLCLFVVVVIVYVFIRHHKFSSMTEQMMKDKEEGVPNIYISPKLIKRPIPGPHDRWEVPLSRIEFGEVLGEGAFGKVIQGKIEGRVLTHQNSQSSLVKEWARSQDVTVAIKMLHEYAEDTQRNEFLREIELMKDIGHHQNVVSIIACCTVQEPLCLIVQHCQDGDLLKFLRQRRSELVANNQNIDESEKLNPSDLLSFARQIAIGMEFLSQKGFVHRDLAARNVLVSDHKTVKIGDFGLTRYIYDDKIYHNKKGGKLPIKWMSVEAIFDQVFTTQSDIWSFGVVLFELVTLGGCPYPGISNQDVVNLLKRGYRMEKPDNCSDNLYEIMLICWREKTAERPTFTDLRKQLEDLLEQNTPYLDFNLDENKDYYVFSSSGSSADTCHHLDVTDTDSGEEETATPDSLKFIIGSDSSSGDSGTLSRCLGHSANDLNSQYSSEERNPLMENSVIYQNNNEETDGQLSLKQHIYIQPDNSLQLNRNFIRKDFHQLIETVV